MLTFGDTEFESLGVQEVQPTKCFTPFVVGKTH